MARRVQQQAAPDAIMTGPDGVAMQSVNVGRSRPFARACLDIWRKRDGKNRSHWMGYASFWVPVDIIAPARAVLEAAAEEAGQGP